MMMAGAGGGGGVHALLELDNVTMCQLDQSVGQYIYGEPGTVVRGLSMTEVIVFFRCSSQIRWYNANPQS